MDADTISLIIIVSILWLFTGWLFSYLSMYIMNVKGRDVSKMKLPLVILGPIGVLISAYMKDLRPNDQRGGLSWFILNPFRILVGVGLIAFIVTTFVFIDSRCQYPGCYKRGTMPATYVGPSKSVTRYYCAEHIASAPITISVPRVK
jgi:hypothetical protein